MDDRVDSMLAEVRSRRRNWREAELDDLRTRYACLLADIAWHRTVTRRGEGAEANQMLWDTADKEML
jgi:hypothetical protein